MRRWSRGLLGSGGSKSRSFLSLALWEVSSPARCQALIVLGAHGEPLGGLVDCEQTAGSESIGVAGEIVGAAQVDHDVCGEVLVHAGAPAGRVELLGGFGVGVIVEELVEHPERVGVGLSCLPGVERDRDREAGRLATAEADVEVDLIGLVDRDVRDEQAVMRLRSRAGVVGSFQSLGKSVAS
jgi:hypothetical protein